MHVDAFEEFAVPIFKALLPWRWRKQVPLKCEYSSTKLCSVLPQKFSHTPCYENLTFHIAWRHYKIYYMLLPVCTITMDVGLMCMFTYMNAVPVLNYFHSMPWRQMGEWLYTSALIEGELSASCTEPLVSTERRLRAVYCDIYGCLENNHTTGK
jgi:hypothetical protein